MSSPTKKTKEKKDDQYSVGYSTGYGQAKADVLLAINEAYKLIDGEIRSPLTTGNITPTEQQRKELLQKQQALRWVSSIVKGLSKKNKG